MGQITSRRFRRKTENSSNEDKAFSDNDIARNNDQPWTPFEFSKPSKSVSAGQCLSSISVASESQGQLTAANSATLKPRLGALEERPLVGHRSELTIASGSIVDHFDQRKPNQRLASSDVILRKNAPGSGNGRKLEGVLFSDDSKVSEVLSQTVTFLSYEIDPILIAEFIQRRASKRINRRTASASAAAAGESGRGEGVGRLLPGCDSDEDVSKILSRIVSDLNSDEYRSFCDLIRTIGCDGHVLDFLEALDDLLRLMTSSGAGNQEETPVLETKRRSKELPCGGCTCSLSSDDERIFWNQMSSSSSSSSHSVGDRRFEIRFVYADRESRLAQSFPDVEQLKRRKRRRSRLPSVDGGRAAVVGDTSDRYVPMISVHLFNACLCDSQMRRLGRILETKACVRDLSIAKTQFDTPAKVRLGHAVGRNVGLFQLDLRGSTLGNDGAMYLANSLRHNRSVRILNLSTTGINGRGCAVLARALSRNRTGLTDLDLASNEIGDAGCGRLSVVIGENCSLRRLRLSSNAIGCDGAALLFLSLKTNSQLQSLDVADNDAIGDGAVAVLSEVLIVNHTLRDLALDRCGVTEVGCRAFARTLKANMKLRRLRLSDNPLMDGGLGSLAEGIKFNRSLEDLDFTGCGITDVGLLQLLDATRYNGTLKSVRLCRNDVTVTSRASFPSMPSSSSHRIWAWKVLETGGDSSTAGAAVAAADEDAPPVDAFEIYTKLRQANPNLSIVLKENGITRTVV